jgi:hypothetical protein
VAWFWQCLPHLYWINRWWSVSEISRRLNAFGDVELLTHTSGSGAA